MKHVDRTILLEKCDETLAFKVSKTMKERIEDLAKKYKTTPSTIMRYIALRYICQDTGKKDLLK